MDDKIVVPGERLGTEEEFTPGENTFADNGVIYSASVGVPNQSEGRINVSVTSRDVRSIGRDMLVIGSVTDDVRSVIFVKIDNISSANKDFLALKDGKILMPKPRMGGRGRFGDRGAPRERRPEPRPEKPASVGDIIIASVQFNDKDSYQLTLNTPQTGVVYALCESCGGEVELERESNQLVCKVCKHRERRKISELYGKPEEIKKLFA